ncbi:condensation domain-containing protein [Chondromyces apiculatus]|nr:condensation domain-containing protein [Chondromyces apiculatus]
MMTTTTMGQRTPAYPLSSPQREGWVDAPSNQDAPPSSQGGYARIEGPLDVAVLERALGHVVAENDALRIALVPGETAPAQKIMDHVPVALDYVDCKDVSGSGGGETKALEWLHETLEKPLLQVGQGPLFHFAVVRVAEELHYWMTRVHPLIADGWAISLMIQRTAAAYDALRAGRPLDEGAKRSYADFIADDQAYMASEQFQRDAAYWREKLETIPEPLLPSRSFGRAAPQPRPRWRSELLLDRARFGQLQAFALEQGTTPFQVILATLYGYFARVTQRDDVAFGLCAVNRSTVDFRQTVGRFSTTVPAWYQLGTSLSFRELLVALGHEAKRGAPHRRFPLSEVNRLAGVYGDRPFDVTLSCSGGGGDVWLGEASASFRALTASNEQKGLRIHVEKLHAQGGIRLAFDGSSESLAKAEILRLPARLENLLTQVMQRPDRPLRDLQILTRDERRQLGICLSGEWAVMGAVQ